MNFSSANKSFASFAAIVCIAVLCFVMLIYNRESFRLASKPNSVEVLRQAEIDGALNCLANQSGNTIFSVREQLNQLYQARLSPLANNPDFGFYQNAAVGDLIH